MEATAWFAMYAPAGLQPQDLQRLERAVMAAVRKPALNERLVRLGYDPVGSSSTELAAQQRIDLARWEKPIKATGVQLD
jgi:tripartite-type tricarboxylate transporter receptor subunit TctC